MKKINHAIYTNKMKEKYHMAHLIDGDKPFDKTQQPFMLRISHQNRSRRKNPQSVKGQLTSYLHVKHYALKFSE